MIKLVLGTYDDKRYETTMGEGWDICTCGRSEVIQRLWQVTLKDPKLRTKTRWGFGCVRKEWNEPETVRHGLTGHDTLTGGIGWDYGTSPVDNDGRLVDLWEGWRTRDCGHGPVTKHTRGKNDESEKIEGVRYTTPDETSRGWITIHPKIKTLKNGLTVCLSDT